MTSDAELLQQSRTGHREAFEALVERYQNLVCAVTFGGTGDRALAADLAQETFVTAWTALPTLRDDSRFRSWLCGIARNLVGKTRRKARPTETTETTETTGELIDPTPDAEAQIEDLRSEALVREILDDMDETFREPLVLFYWEGRSTKEVAATLGLSVSAVEQRLSRGRRRIKAEVEARVDRALQSAKPDRKFRAMVLAAIEGIPAPAADATPSTSTRVTKTAVAAGLAAVSAAGWVAWSSSTSDGQTDPTPEVALAAAATAEEALEPPAPLPAATAPQRQALPIGSADAAASPGEPDDDTQTIGEDLQLEHYPNRVIVNLHGGPSGLSDEEQTKLEGGAALPFNKDGKITDRPTRRVEGTVLDPDGNPIEGAVVVAGDIIALGRLRRPSGRMRGDAGDTTDARGQFSFDASTSELLVTAVAHPFGFSSIVDIDASEDPIALELVLEGNATVEGDVTFEGEPTMGYVAVTSLASDPDTHLDSMHATDEGGHFDTTGLPPGKYLLYASANLDGQHGWQGQQGPNSRTVIELAAGDAMRHDFDFTRGVTVELRATRPGELTYYVFPGTQLERWSDASPLMQDLTNRVSIAGSTPDDEAAFAVIQGIAAEPMTACAVRPHNLFAGPSYAECQTLPTPPSADATVSVTFDPPPE